MSVWREVGAGVFVRRYGFFDQNIVAVLGDGEVLVVDGGSPGANASFEVFPQAGYVVIVLSNQGQGSRDVAQQLISLVLART